MRFRGGEFSTGTMGNFQPELTAVPRRSGWPEAEGAFCQPSPARYSAGRRLFVESASWISEIFAVTR